MAELEHGFDFTESNMKLPYVVFRIPKKKITDQLTRNYAYYSNTTGFI